MNNQEKTTQHIIEFLKFTVNCINEKSPISFIILSHLKIEQALQEHLEKRLKINLKCINKEALNRAIKNHNQLLDMCYAIGILKKAYYQSLLELNKIRNKVVHKLDYKISIKEQESLISKLPDKAKDREKLFDLIDNSLAAKEKEFRSCLIEIYSTISFPLYHKVKRTSLLGGSRKYEVEIDDIRHN